MTVPSATATVSPLIYGLFTPTCYDVLLVQGRIFEWTCLKLLISKLLSYVIIAGSCILKARYIPPLQLQWAPPLLFRWVWQ